MTNKKKDKENKKNTSKDEGLSVEVFNKNLLVLLNTKPVREDKKSKDE